MGALRGTKEPRAGATDGEASGGKRGAQAGGGVAPSPLRFSPKLCSPSHQVRRRLGRGETKKKKERHMSLGRADGPCARKDPSRRSRDRTRARAREPIDPRRGRAPRPLRSRSRPRVPASRTHGARALPHARADDAEGEHGSHRPQHAQVLSRPPVRFGIGRARRAVLEAGLAHREGGGGGEGGVRNGTAAGDPATKVDTARVGRTVNNERNPTVEPNRALPFMLGGGEGLGVHAYPRAAEGRAEKAGTRRGGRRIGVQRDGAPMTVVI